MLTPVKFTGILNFLFKCSLSYCWMLRAISALILGLQYNYNQENSRSTSEIFTLKVDQFVFEVNIFIRKWKLEQVTFYQKMIRLSRIHAGISIRTKCVFDKSVTIKPKKITLRR